MGRFITEENSISVCHERTKGSSDAFKIISGIMHLNQDGQNPEN